MRSIGYVPQHIYLTDDSIESNIAFGISHNNINEEALIRASKTAQIHDFVMNELSEQYKTIVGERGIKLSGGQRQRIGIARALYHNPEVLILDEATSSLDQKTEKEIVKTMNYLNKKFTIIQIAHRLNTIKNCKIIFKIENGQIVDVGEPNQMINENNND